MDASVDIAWVAPMEPVPESRCRVLVATEAPPTESSMVPEPLADSVTSVKPVRVNPARFYRSIRCRREVEMIAV